MGKLKLSGLAVWLACSAAFAQEGPSDFTTQVPLAVSGSGPGIAWNCHWRCN